MQKLILTNSFVSARFVQRSVVALLLAVVPFEQALQAAGPTLPTGGTFTAGSGTVSQNASSVTIHQATNRGIIDWSTFSIGNQGHVLFFNGSGATLNRVTGNQMSTILGSLRSTGTVYLINPQGVLIGPRGQIKTGGDFVASTLNLSNNSFLSGGSLVFTGNSKAFIKNLGTVSSTGGSIFLIANQASNSGSLSARNGSVGLAAGGQVLIKDSTNDERIFVKAAGGNATNSGSISAAQVELKANGGNVYALAGNSGGQIRATGTATRNGSVWLVSDGGTTKVSGSISAENANGKGGFIETSGSTVDIAKTSIGSGIGGTWLVDPVDLTIDSSAASTIQSALNGGTNVTESTSTSGSSGYGTTASGNGDINVASGISWNSSASLTLSAYRNINVGNGVSIAGGGSGSLTLQADNAATGTGTITFTGTGNIHFTGSGNVDLFYHPAAFPTATSYSGNVTMGSGTLTPYMTVDTAADLQNINSNLSGNYALNTDVDAGSISNFVPIAHGVNYTNSSQGFSGLFDGRSHTIGNLNINDSTDTAVGLFAQTSSAGRIRSVGLVGATVHNSLDNSSIGALVGENFGTITQSYVTGTVSTTGVGNTFVGGFVGENDGQISDSYSSASVSAVTQSGCDGCISIGGFAGDNGFSNPSASISSSLATGLVSTTGSALPTIGGFAGENDADISGSYFDSQTTGQSTATGFYNGTTNSVAGQTTAQLKSGSLPAGFNASIWTASAGAYPKLSWQIPAGISVTGIVYNGTTPLGSITVVGLANGTSFGSTTTNASGAFTLLAPSGTAGILTYLTGGYKGNTFSNNASPSFSGVDIYTNSLRLINVTTNNYTGMLNALASALGSNSGSNFLFSMSGGNLTLGAGTNFALLSSVATNIDQSIAGTGTVQVQSSGNLTLNASTTISAAGTGTPLTLVSGGAFSNNAGANALSTSGGGRWLVYSQNPANDTLGSLSYGFKQYNASFGSTTVAQTTGNGLLYTLAPTLTPSLTGSTSKTYDGGTTATLSSTNFTSAGALTGDTAVLTSSSAVYADKNAGAGKTVTASGLSATAIDSTGASVYGYQLSSTSASGSIGTINAAQLTYAANAASRAYGSSNPAFSGSVTGFVGADTQGTATTGTLAFSSPATTASNVGSYAINGSGLTANNGNYTFQQAAGNATALAIDPAALSYIANAASRTYGSANAAFSGTVTGFLNGDTQASATTGSLSFSSLATTTSNAGSYAINGSGLTAGSNYTLQQAAGNATALTINPALLTYTANAANRNYGSANPAFTGAVTGFMNGETQASATTGSLAFISPANAASNVGSYAINGSGLTANNGNYTFQQAVGNASALTIDPAVLTYGAGAVSRIYGSTNPTFTGAVTGFVNGETQASATSGTLAFTTAATAASNTGSYAINGSGLTANNGNYSFQQAAGNATALTIDPATLTYTANAAARTYGAANPALSGAVTGFVNGETQASATSGTLAFTTPATSTSNAGSYAIDGSGLTANNGNYVFQQAASNADALTINAASLIYTADGATRSYGGANPTFTGAVTGFVNGETQASATTGSLAFTSPATTATSVGSYAINGSGLTANNGNYTFQQAAGNASALTIDPAVLTYAADTASRTYGDSNPAFTGSVTGFVNGDTKTSATTGSLSFSSSATSASNTGNYAIDGSGLTANSGNYIFQQAANNATALTIDPATLTYTANAAARTYGDANPAFSGTVTGFVNGETQGSATSGTLSFTSPATTASNVGTHAVNGSGLTANNGNYIFQQAAGNGTALTIDPATLTYTAATANRTYGAANPTFSGTVTGFVNGETQASATAGTLAFTSPATTASGIGAYAISGSGLTANSGNYIFQQAVSNAAALSIDPAALIYTADTATRTYGRSNPVFTGSVTGFVNGDTLSTATSGSAIFTSAAGSTSHVGTYAVNGSGLTVTDGNYTLQQAPGNASALSITPAQLTASILAGNKVYDATTNASGQIGALSGVLNGDNVSVDSAGATYTFSDKNVGTGKAVTETGATLAGPSASDYMLAVNPGAADISPARVYATLSAHDKIYDTTTSATGQIGSLSGVLGADSVALDSSAGMYKFADKNVGSEKAVSASGAVLTGADAANYTLVVPDALAAITPAPIAAVLSANNKIYDGTAAAHGSIGPLNGVLGSDTVSLNTSAVSYAFDTPTAATGKTVTQSGASLGGADAANYRLTVQSGVASINPVRATVSIVDATRIAGAPNPGFLATYSGQTLPGVDISALLSSVSFETAATTASKPGTYLVTGTSSYPNVDLTIVPGTLNVTFTDTPQTDPSVVTAKRTIPPPLTATALASVIAPNSLGILQVNYSTDWSGLGGSGSRTSPLASSSFFENTSSATTYPGGIRPW